MQALHQGLPTPIPAQFPSNPSLSCADPHSPDATRLLQRATAGPIMQVLHDADMASPAAITPP